LSPREVNLARLTAERIRAWIDGLGELDLGPQDVQIELPTEGEH
jgi:hypothetical protein